MTRVVAGKLSESMPPLCSVANRPGASAHLAAKRADVIASPPDLVQSTTIIQAAQQGMDGP